MRNYYRHDYGATQTAYRRDRRRRLAAVVARRGAAALALAGLAALGASAWSSLGPSWVAARLADAGLFRLEEIVVGGTADGGPAERAGVHTGDRIVAVGNEEIADLAGLWRRVWACGSAGAEVKLRVMRDERERDLTIRSADRASFLKTPKLH